MWTFWIKVRRCDAWKCLYSWWTNYPHCSVNFFCHTLVLYCKNFIILKLFLCKTFYRSVLLSNVHIYIHIYIYTGCHRKNGPNFGRVFLMLNYTNITQNTYVQSWTVSEIMASEVWNFDSCYTLTDYQIHIETGRNMWFL